VCYSAIADENRCNVFADSGIAVLHHDGRARRVDADEVYAAAAFGHLYIDVNRLGRRGAAIYMDVIGCVTGVRACDVGVRDVEDGKC
jgi:hypothetical protein